MPRGRKKKEVLSFDEQVESLKNEIKEMEIKLKDKKAELKKLEKSADELKAKEFLDALSTSGKSMADVMEFLKTEVEKSDNGTESE